MEVGHDSRAAVEGPAPGYAGGGGSSLSADAWPGGARHVWVGRAERVGCDYFNVGQSAMEW